MADQPRPPKPTDLSALAWGDAPEMGERPGDRVGPYRLEHLLGEGGFGMVWLAERTAPIHQRVAVKLIKPGMDSRRVLRRFDDERRAMERLEHPGIARILDAGVTPDARPFVVMEFVDGMPIDTAADALTLDLSDRLRLFLRVCSAVQHAHQRGIIHRDLKPSNVLVATNADGPSPKVIDFGIARALEEDLSPDRSLVTEEGRFVGTPEYMSPEQALGPSADVDTRADIYALGVILYKLLSGELPFDLAGARKLGHAAVREAIRHARFVQPSARVERAADDGAEAARARRTDPRSLARQLRGDLDWIVTKAMHPEREQRYASASELAADISRHLSSLPVSAGPLSKRYRLGKFVERHRAGVAVAFAFAVLVLAGLGLFAAQAFEIARQRDRAEGALRIAERRLVHRDAVAAHEALLRLEPAAADAPLARVLASSAGFERALLAGLADQSQPIEGTDRAHQPVALDGSRLALLLNGQPFLMPSGLPAALTRLWPAWTHDEPCIEITPAFGGVAARSLDGSLWFAGIDAPRPEPFGPPAEPARALVAIAPDLLLSAHTDARGTGSLRLWTRPLDAAGPSESRLLAASDPSPVAIAGTPDASIIAAAGFDGRVLIWEDTRSRPARALVHPAPVRALAVSESGTVAVGDESGTITLWDGRTGVRTLSIAAHRGPVTALAFAGSDAVLLSGSADRVLRSWDPSSGAPTGSALGHRAPPTTIMLPGDAFGGGRGTLFSADGIGPLRLWHPDSSFLAGRQPAHAARIERIEPAPSGATLISKAADGSARSWRLGDLGLAPAAPITDTNLYASEHEAPITAALRSPDGVCLVTADADGRLVLWDQELSEPILTLQQAGAPIAALAFLADGSTLVVGSADGTLATFPPRASEPVETTPLPAAAWVMDARAVDAEGRAIEPARLHEEPVWIELAWASSGGGVRPASALVRLVDDEGVISEELSVPLQTDQPMSLVRLGPIAVSAGLRVRVSVVSLDGRESPGLIAWPFAD
ncbi:MAG: WD40 repeat domain-containing serine/threonine protein kinase [Phycisphaerales bacterium JB037]